jgi:hypothetical protein
MLIQQEDIMKHNGWVKAAIIACIAATASSPLLVTAKQQYSESDYYLYEPGPMKKSTLYLDGSVVDP